MLGTGLVRSALDSYVSVIIFISQIKMGTLHSSQCVAQYMIMGSVTVLVGLAYVVWCPRRWWFLNVSSALSSVSLGVIMLMDGVLHIQEDNSVASAIRLAILEYWPMLRSIATVIVLVAGRYEWLRLYGTIWSAEDDDVVTMDEVVTGVQENWVTLSEEMLDLMNHR